MKGKKFIKIIEIVTIFVLIDSDVAGRSECIEYVSYTEKSKQRQIKAFSFVFFVLIKKYHWQNEFFTK